MIQILNLETSLAAERITNIYMAAPVIRKIVDVTGRGCMSISYKLKRRRVMAKFVQTTLIDGYGGWPARYGSYS